MSHFRKLQLTYFISKISHTCLKPSQSPRFHSAKSAPQSALKNCDFKFPSKVRKEAQVALLEYLHSTRSLQFLDADNMCKNSPFFLNDILSKVLQKKKIDTAASDVKKSISRYLRYHPINEFEPFFESTGLKPFEYLHLLPRDMMFINDDTVLMENYHTLCNYGVPRNKMGKIFKDAPQVFRYESGVLVSKFQSYEELGVASSTLVKVISLSPRILVGDVDLYLVKVLEKLNRLVGEEKGSTWIEEQLLDESSCNFGVMHELLCLLEKVYSDKKLLGEMIGQHPFVCFEDSGVWALSLIVFLVKLGLSLDQIAIIFVKFPQIGVLMFLSNLRKCFTFLSDIDMHAAEIGNIFQSHSLLMGSFTIKKSSSLLSSLNVGKKRVCKLVQDNPEGMQNWAVGRKIQPYPEDKEMRALKTEFLKTKFLLSLGYEENSEGIKQAFKLFRGKGDELQERYDFIVNAGLDAKDVREMIKASPQILNQTTDMINTKIEYLVNEGYPISSLVDFPSFLSYTLCRVKLRLSMYNWLRDHRVVHPRLALSTIVACSEELFLRLYVNRHPSGLQVWQDLKSEIYPENNNMI
ncbi:hypothetical protein HN51_015282 [Arachis hypogaea]|uniref:transcription termination factor MTEF18, mitochondrial-like n=1 Tax=Arachis hypogaea TaxID=3818 RepID=UPI000DEC3289|nr:transcription termination factor MTEF18, mitochondrial-like [Arachis hypogaea]XP_029143285.1 transcription termination factor MTEF18, mitochondrial-like [Arachis hypogaea]XP_029143286.1 transcription termination factor MTEF18, mitochondrial-like [Arachis hypogaea]QHO44672.1 uncharacterized protein DS421_6g172760 [Arachis hypogaea]QHO44673.1 uncharacterized protein DS421_6g172760 [Arachis hypogaea]QHO44674.1 uncharacterized protein DS421_6g172760 [Arachis hypogaea]